MTSKYDQLREEFSEFYSNIAFECGPGWYQILHDLSMKLREHINLSSHDHKSNGLSFYPTQIKEKYGTLQYYVSSSCDEMDKLIEDAEILSQHTCEACGNAGKFHNIGWYYTRCDECLELIKRST